MCLDLHSRHHPLYLADIRNLRGPDHSGRRRGTYATVVYLLLGAVGLPVFSGFQAGIGTLLGATGGFILGFAAQALVYWLLTAHLGTSVPAMAAAGVISLAVCYAFGTIWFLTVYARSTGPVRLGTALSWCVIPFIQPDLGKLALASPSPCG